MVQGVLIAIVAVVVLRESVPGLPLVKGVGGWVIAAWALCPLVVLAAMAHGAIALCGRAIDRTGAVRWALRAEWALACAWVFIAISHAVAVLGLGWLDSVRGVCGDLVLVDEAIVTLPPVVAMVAGWWSFASIDRRMREASLVRQLDAGQAVAMVPTRWSYVVDHVRHQVLLIVLPIAIIIAWSESVDAGVKALGSAGAWPAGALGEAAQGAVHIAGVLGALAMMPMVLKAAWDTLPLGPGELRDRLEALCRVQGVRCRDILVWRTGSGMLNGAVVGLLPRLRYILLTDALLEQLPDRQVEAVMAHEVAHARHHHLPWLMLAMLLMVGGVWTGGWALADAGLSLLELSVSGAEPAPGTTAGAGVLSALASLVSLAGGLVVGLVVLGFVSRVFERQADAFAAQHLSGHARNLARERGAPAPEVTSEAAGAMVGALGLVARLNHIPPERFSWRHGSIARRQSMLRGLIGRRADRLAVDGQVRWIKRLAGAALLAALGAAAWALWSALSDGAVG